MEEWVNVDRLAEKNRDFEVKIEDNARFRGRPGTFYAP